MMRNSFRSYCFASLRILKLSPDIHNREVAGASCATAQEFSVDGIQMQSAAHLLSKQRGPVLVKVHFALLNAPYVAPML
jgi:hypothetical protein